MHHRLVTYSSRYSSDISPRAYLETSQIPMMDLFSKNSEQLFDWVSKYVY